MNSDIATNGRHCLELILKRLHRPYKLIFMDLMMPIMDGYEATARIRQLYGSGYPCKIVALSAMNMKEDLSKCIAAGMNQFSK